MMRKLRFSFAYFHKPRWDTGISPPEVMGFIANQPPGKALDLGCGTGTNAITLRRHGWEVIGIDFARRAIQIARKRALQSGVEVDLRMADVTRLESIKGPFDLILDIGCFHSLPPDKRPAYIDNVDRLLAETGIFLIYLFYKVEPGVNKPGVTDADIQTILQKLHLVDRKEGFEHGGRPSAWLTLQKY